MAVYSNESQIEKKNSKFYRLTGENEPDYGKYVSFVSEGNTIFFIGIGGISMCGLAELSACYGATCYGSDPNPNQRTEYLKTELGLKIWDAHRSQNIDQANHRFGKNHQ